MNDVEGDAIGSAQKPSPSWKGSMETKYQAENDRTESLMAKRDHSQVLAEDQRVECVFGTCGCTSGR